MILFILSLCLTINNKQAIVVNIHTTVGLLVKKHTIGIVTLSAIDLIDTILVTYFKAKYTATPENIDTGASNTNAPIVVFTPFPPLNPRNGV